MTTLGKSKAPPGKRHRVSDKTTPSFGGQPGASPGISFSLSPVASGVACFSSRVGAGIGGGGQRAGI